MLETARRQRGVLEEEIVVRNLSALASPRLSRLRLPRETSDVRPVNGRKTERVTAMERGGEG